MKDANGNYILVANNTFGGNVCGWPTAAGGPTPCVNGDFGDIGGGILLYSYFEWIRRLRCPSLARWPWWALRCLAWPERGAAASNRAWG